MTTRDTSFDHLSDQDLLREVARLAAREREATACLIASLAVLDRRRLYLAEGYASMFVYCTKSLHLSEASAYKRITVARAAQRFPVILERLAEGTVSLATVSLLTAHLTAENHVALLDEARNRSKRGVEEIVARLQPRPDVPSTVRKVPAPKSPAPEALFAWTMAALAKTADTVPVDAPPSVPPISSSPTLDRTFADARCICREPHARDRGTSSYHQRATRDGHAAGTRALQAHAHHRHRDLREAPAGARPAASHRAQW